VKDLCRLSRLKVEQVGGCTLGIQVVLSELVRTADMSPQSGRFIRGQVFLVTKDCDASE